MACPFHVNKLENSLKLDKSLKFYLFCPLLFAGESYNLTMNLNLVFKLLRLAAVCGNVVFVLWIIYNAIDDGFQGTPYEIASGIGLILLLSLNSVLLFLNRDRSGT
jgi:hypothetical protein